MTRFTRLQVLDRIIQVGMVPTFYHPDLDTAIGIVAACAAAGANVIEFTNRGDLAHEVFAGLVRHFAQADPSIMLGAGTVIDPSTAALYIACGAGFIVAPVLNPEVARICNRRKIAYLPGCGSASEISAAEELGVEICKIFPGNEVGGPAFVKAILGPCPWTRLMPTGNSVEFSEDCIRAWFQAGAAAVGPGPTLITADIVARKDWAAITERTSQMLGWIRKARG